MKIKVLIVDDEKEFAKALAERLAIRNFEVESVNSGAEALERIRQGNIDVVLLDVLMPGMDGIETFAKIRKLDPTIQVVMLTGHAKIETAIDGIKDGIYDYILKPVKIDELVGKIEMAFQQKEFVQQQTKQKKPDDKNP